MNNGIYIHIPFCLQKCDYCDFLSLECTDKQEEYVTALLQEIESVNVPNIDTIFIGGGTPTALPPFLLCKILQAIKAKTSIPNIEITVESNPGTLTQGYLQELKQAGVNRLSMGLQTTQARLLNAIGRIHTLNDFLENYQAARKVGFNNINVDLMFGLPGQTLQNWHETLDEIIKLNPEHISCYSLTPAEHTPLFDNLMNDILTLPDDETNRAMYHAAREKLTTAGYNHYEISNFAKPGRECKHNINCWKRVPYRGFGLGASSFDGKMRWTNTEDMAEYINGTNTAQDTDILTAEGHAAETMILGLRMLEGIPAKDIPQQYHSIVAHQIEKGLLAHSDGSVRLTAQGLDLANQVFMAFL